MDGQSASLDFALIGHLESWQKAEAFMKAVRNPELKPLRVDQIKDLFPYFPPRKVFNLSATSTHTQKTVRGGYIETFIPPHSLTPGHFREIIKKVHGAAEVAARHGAKVASLGGFTSIILEGKTHNLPGQDVTAFTTGNTLTAAFVVKGMEQACQLHGMSLADCDLLIVGSTGDIGTACVRYFAGKVKKLLLCARNQRVLQEQHNMLQARGVDCAYSTEASELIPSSDLIISVASTEKPLFSLNDCQPHTLVCDAGYPKNIIANSTSQLNRIWKGGMGQVTGGVSYSPDYTSIFYASPAPYVGHGCMIEPTLLAMDGRFESYSTQRGKITVEKIEEIWAIARKHGCSVAPFFHDQLWDKQLTFIEHE